MHHHQGFSLLDLLLALSIMSIVAVLAAPQFSELTTRAKPVIESERLLASIWAARHAAITQGKPVTMKATGSDWSEGWILFVDDNHSATQEANESLLHAAEPIKKDHQLKANSGIGMALSYLPHGESRRPSGSLQMGTFTLCAPSPTEGIKPTHAIVISATGRPRTIQSQSQLNASICEAE